MIDQEIIDVFKSHNLVLVDNSEYDGKRCKIIKERIVSPKWITRVLNNKLRERLSNPISELVVDATKCHEQIEDNILSAEKIFNDLIEAIRNNEIDSSIILAFTHKGNNKTVDTGIISMGQRNYTNELMFQNYVLTNLMEDFEKNKEEIKKAMRQMK